MKKLVLLPLYLSLAILLFIASGCLNKNSFVSPEGMYRRSEDVKERESYKYDMVWDKEHISSPAQNKT